MKPTSILLIVILFSGCASTARIGKHQPSPAIRIYTGLNKGGIIENTDMTIMDNVAPDAYTGATRTGFHTGVHYEYFSAGLMSFESGLDIIGNSQLLSYSDMENEFIGERQLFTTQMRIPLTINLRLFQKTNPEGNIKLKLGISPGISYIKQTASEGTLPDYSTSAFSLGPVMGLEVTPFKIKDKFNPGFYFMAFRSAQGVYNDYYQEGDMPGLSYLSFGVTWKIN